MKSIFGLAVFFLYSTAAFSATKIYVTNTPPYVMDGGKSGIAIDIINELFKKAGEPVEIEVSPLVRSFANVLKQPSSCVAPVQRTQEREYDHYWVGPLIVTSSSVFGTGAVESGPKFVFDLEGETIGSLRGSSEAEYLKGLVGLKVEEADDENQNLKKLQGGRFKYWVTDSSVGQYIAQKEKVQVNEFVRFRRTLRALACNLEYPKAKIKKLNEVLSGMYKDKSIDAIFKKWNL